MLEPAFSDCSQIYDTCKLKAKRKLQPHRPHEPRWPHHRVKAANILTVYFVTILLDHNDKSTKLYLHRTHLLEKPLESTADWSIIAFLHAQRSIAAPPCKPGMTDLAGKPGRLPH